MRESEKGKEEVAGGREHGSHKKTRLLFSSTPTSLPFILPFPPLPSQHIDTGELLMQAFADRAAVGETLQTG